ncbi:hypothetical protein GCM10010452_76590 [Crossiella cryophila]
MGLQVGQLLGGLLARGAAELVRDFAEPVAAAVVMELARVPGLDRADFQRWVREASGIEGAVTPRVWAELEGYLAELSAHHEPSADRDAVSTGREGLGDCWDESDSRQDETARRQGGTAADRGGSRVCWDDAAGQRDELEPRRDAAAGPWDESPVGGGAVAGQSGDGRVYRGGVAGRGGSRVSAVEVVAGYVRIVDLISDALLTLLGCPEQLAVLRRDPLVLAAVIREVVRGDADAGDLGLAGVVAEAAVRAVLGCDVLLAGDEEELRWRARLGIRELRSIPVTLERRPVVGGGR